MDEKKKFFFQIHDFFNFFFLSEYFPKYLTKYAGTEWKEV